MNKPPLLTSNFAHLQAREEQLLRLGMLAERYFPDDPNTSLLKLRQLAELLAQLVATKVVLFQSPEESQYDLLRRLQDQGILPREIAQLFGEVRRAGNAASHAVTGDHRTALAALKIIWQLGLWFHRAFTNPSFTSGPFIPPQAPLEESAAPRAELTRLSQALEQGLAAHRETAQRLNVTEARLREAKDEQTFWEQMASEAESAKAALEQRLAAHQAETAAQPREAVTAFVAAANTAAEALHLDEAETRQLIRQAPGPQLRHRGDRQCRQGRADAQGRRPVEHLRDHRQGPAAHRRPQRHQDGRHPGQPVCEWAVGAAVWLGRREVPQGRDQAAVVRADRMSAWRDVDGSRERRYQVNASWGDHRA